MGNEEWPEAPEHTNPTNWTDVAIFLIGAVTLCFIVWVIWG